MWQSTKATVVGRDKVEVGSDAGAAPIAARYAWTDNPGVQSFLQRQAAGYPVPDRRLRTKYQTRILTDRRQRTSARTPEKFRQPYREAMRNPRPSFSPRGLNRAALDPRIAAVVSVAPALGEHTGPLHGPPDAAPSNLIMGPDKKTPDLKIIAATAYYDTCNFARFVTVPVLMSRGLIGTACPPMTARSIFILSPPNASLVPPHLRLHRHRLHLREKRCEGLIQFLGLLRHFR